MDQTVALSYLIFQHTNLVFVMPQCVVLQK